MRATTQLTVATLLTLFATATGFAADLIPWAGDLPSAQREAAQSGKLVLIHFCRDGCPPCRIVEARVFSRPEVASAIGAKYVPVKINGTHRPDVARQFGVDRFPMDVIITPAGNKIDAFVSPQDPSRYVGSMDAVFARLNPHTRQAQAPNQQTGAMPNGAMPNQSPSRWGGESYSPSGSPYGALANAQPPQQAQAASRYGNQPSQDYDFNRNNLPPRQGGMTGQPAGQVGSQWPPSGADAVASARYGNQPAQDAASSSDSRYGQAQPSFQARSQADQYQQPANQRQQPSNEYQSQVQPARQPQATRQAQAQENRFSGEADSRYGGGESRQGADAAGSRSQMYEWQKDAPQNAQPEPRAAAEASTAAQPEIAMDGFCPVTLVQQERWQKGDANFGAVHRGRTYIFADLASRDSFLTNPDAFSPVLSGYDPVRFVEQGQMVDGKRRHGVFYDGKIYLFSDEPSLQKFWRSPINYVNAVNDAMSRNAAAPQSQVNR